MMREEIYKLSLDEVLELAKQEGLKRKAAKEAAKPKPVVTLATANPEVPLERQRERISEAQRKLIADEERKLQELAEANAREQLRVQRHELSTSTWR
jgi:septum formation inhibitor MinC